MVRIIKFFSGNYYHLEQHNHLVDWNLIN